MPPRKTAGSKAAGKRRRVQSDNSDIEVLDSVVSPRKKQVTSKVLPASQEPIYNMLAQPDLTAELDALLDVSPSGQSSSIAPRPRPIRSRAKTEKGKLLTESSTSTVRRNIRNATTPPVMGGLDTDDELPEHVLPIDSKHVEVPKVTPTPPGDAASTPDAPQINQGFTLLESLYDDVAVDSDDVDNQAECDSVESFIDDSDTGSVRSGKNSRTAQNVDGSSTNYTLDVKPNTTMLESTEPVMVPDFQHPKLLKIYDKLPVLSRFCDVVPFGGRSNSSVERADFGAVIQGLPKPTVLIILSGLTFVKSGFFVNTARANPACLGMEARRLVIANTTTHAVCIMMGTVVSCDLIARSHTSGSYTTHQISILPFAQEMRRDSSVWGMKLGGWDRIVGPVDSGGFAFHTRPKSNTQQWVGQSPQTPKKNKSKTSVVISSPSSRPQTTTSSGNQGYPQSRSFEEGVPIYDGRAKTSLPFKFTDKDFDRLTSMPLYRNGREDLPMDAIVAVGYTLNTYVRHYNGGSTEQLSSNVLFVILLGIKPT
ncbi:hypothetical protein BD779DRAFT_1675678 [Infundibulicybe gibba]|nr:hypothetical protein BD779DRAFT_1675678 [Infundibulicybe gibba]